MQNLWPRPQFQVMRMRDCALGGGWRGLLMLFAFNRASWRLETKLVNSWLCKYWLILELFTTNFGMAQPPLVKLWYGCSCTSHTASAAYATRPHHMVISQPFAHSNSIFQEWHNLSEEQVSAPSLQAFKKLL